MHILDFLYAIGMLAFTKTSAAEIEAEHGKSKTIQRLHGVENDLIVQGSAVQRMGMTNHRGMGGAGRSGVQQCFQPSGGTGKRQRTNAGSF